MVVILFLPLTLGRMVGPQLEEGLEEVLERLPEPFADPSIVPTSLLCKFARQHVTVAIGGRSLTLTIALVHVEFFFDRENSVVDYRDIDAQPKPDSADEPTAVEPR